MLILLAAVQRLDALDFGIEMCQNHLQAAFCVGNQDAAAMKLDV